jgi:uncharacterized membrane protein
MVARFGRLALASVVLLAVAGGLMAWWHLNLWNSGILAGLTTDYGRVLLAKVVLALAAVVIAWRANKKSPNGGGGWRLTELAVLLTVLAMAGLVVSVRPPS